MERKFVFLLRFLEVGPLGGSTIGADETDGVSGATLGGLGVFVWGITFVGVAGKSSLGSLRGVGSP